MKDGTARLDAGQRIRIIAGWDQQGRKGTVLMHFGAQQILGVDLGQDWVAVKWDDADDPDNFKRAGLEIIPAEDKRWPRPWTAASLMIKSHRRSNRQRQRKTRTFWSGKISPSSHGDGVWTMTRAPYYLRALLDAHTLPRPEISDTTLSELVKDGLVENPNGCIRTTERGSAYVQMLLDVPLPEQKWVDPRKLKA